MLGSRISNFLGDLRLSIIPMAQNPAAFISSHSEIKNVKHHQPDYENHISKDLRHVQEEKTYE